MNIIVTGSTGFMGQQLISKLVPTDATITTIGRLIQPVKQISQIVIASPEDMTFDQFPTGDVFVHLGGLADNNTKTSREQFNRINAHWTSKMAKYAVERSFSHFIFLSSAKVHGDYCHHAITSETAFNPNSYYAESKCEAERLLTKYKNDMAITVLRPPAIYGLPLKGGTKRIVNTISNKKLIPLSRNNNQRSFVDVANVIDAISTCLTEEEKGLRSYALHEYQTISTNNYIDEIARSLNINPRAIRLPNLLLSTIDFTAKITIKSEPLAALHRNFYINCDSFSNRYSWKPIHNTKTGLRKMCASIIKGRLKEEL